MKMEHSCDHCGRKVEKGKQIPGTTEFTKGMEFCSDVCMTNEDVYQQDKAVGSPRDQPPDDIKPVTTWDIVSRW
jgi:hypothetical protein